MKSRGMSRAEFKPETNGVLRFPAVDALSAVRLGIWVASALRKLEVPGKRVIVLCIGTDRSTGDALGPLTGTLLVERGFPEVHAPEHNTHSVPSASPPSASVLGTLENPIHAVTLLDAIEFVRPASVVTVAIDACLGQPEHVGSITVGWGPVRPGAGVNKDLPPVGDIHVTGTVNVAGFMEYLVLQNTRLSTVMRLAKTIADGLTLAMAPGPLLPAKG